ncbi:MAG: histone deacetylase family protein [Cellvibrionaceae bacterium]|nr:histone deacetylase family protein [Cellvibrionaceae bacterium]
MTTAYITHPSTEQHKISENHPECPERIWAIHDALIGSRLMDLLLPITAAPAQRAQLELAHGKDYVDFIFAAQPTADQPVQIDPDTAMNTHTLEAALHAAGAVALAVDKVMAGEINNAFCAVRPPGHHAERNRGMGFCIFNSIAVGAYQALEKHQLSRVAIVDFDVHHGNGSEDIFQDEARVLFCSSYQHPFYPYSGGANVENRRLNIPLTSGTASQQFREAYEQHCFPTLEAFKPELILISAGFDAHTADPLASLCLDEADFAWVTAQLMQIAAKNADGKIVSSLEGGYELGALGRSAAAHVKELLGAAAKPSE